METESRKVSDSAVETVHIVRPNHLNNSGRLFGGILMQWIDEVAALAAKRHCRKNVTTVSVDHLHFIKGAYPKDDIVIKGRVTHVGNTSMEVKVDTYVDDENGERTLINRAYLTEVALGHDDKPVKVPRLFLETEEERQEWVKAEKRRELRKLQKAGGF